MHLLKVMYYEIHRLPDHQRIILNYQTDLYCHLSYPLDEFDFELQEK